MKHKIRITLAVILIIILAAGVFPGCSLRNRGGIDDETDAEYEDFTGIPEIPVAAAPGASVAENRKALIDYSNARDGYIMVRFNEKIKKQARALVTVPDGTQYVFRLEPGGDYIVIPLSGGDGEYSIDMLEEVEDSLYALALTSTVYVVIDDEFAPFLRPNQYVNYKRSSAVVRKAAELTEGIGDEMELIAAIYHFVIENIAYDEMLAVSVESGYLPDVDAVLESGMGICFDYAALMTAMLRSQGVPTRMVLGYTGESYHAWVSVHTDEMGWVDNLIFFDGHNWQIMDPTFTAGGLSSEIVGYVGNASNYNALYQY